MQTSASGERTPALTDERLPPSTSQAQHRDTHNRFQQLPPGRSAAAAPCGGRPSTSTLRASATPRIEAQDLPDCSRQKWAPPAPACPGTHGPNSVTIPKFRRLRARPIMILVLAVLALRTLPRPSRDPRDDWSTDSPCLRIIRRFRAEVIPATPGCVTMPEGTRARTPRLWSSSPSNTPASTRRACSGSTRRALHRRRSIIKARLDRQARERVPALRTNRRPLARPNFRRSI